MAINLATKYSGKLLQPYTLASLLTGKTNTDYDFIGVNSIHIYTAVTQALSDYNKAATANRYGTPAELQDTQQELVLSQDKSFSIVIDRGNNDDQMMSKKSGAVSQAEIKEQVVPYFDGYSLKTWATNAGKTQPLAAVTKDTVIDMVVDAHSWFFNHNIPLNGKDTYMFVPTSTYAKLLLNPLFIGNDKLGEKILTNGVVGKCMDFVVIETPDSYFAAGTQALFVNKKSVIAAQKLNELFVRNDVQGFSGVVIEGRYRGDAFVLDAMKHGVYAVTTQA